MAFALLVVSLAKDLQRSCDHGFAVAFEVIADGLQKSTDGAFPSEGLNNPHIEQFLEDVGVGVQASAVEDFDGCDIGFFLKAIEGQNAGRYISEATESFAGVVQVTM